MRLLSSHDCHRLLAILNEVDEDDRLRAVIESEVILARIEVETLERAQKRAARRSRPS